MKKLNYYNMLKFIIFEEGIVIVYLRVVFKSKPGTMSLSKQP